MLNAEELKELREVIGKAIGHDGPYTWGISDYIAVAEHFKARGQEDLAQEIVTHMGQHDWASPVAEMNRWLREKGIPERGKHE